MPTFDDLYPFDSHYLDLDGHRYHYLDEGEGPVLLMLHGNPTWSFYYRDLIKAFRGTHRVIVPDHMGCGFSDKPQDYSYRLATHIANLERLLDHLEIERYDLVCHDWGGPIGFGVSEKRPDDVGKLVIFNTTSLVTSHYPKRILICKVPVLGTVAIRGLNFFVKEAVRKASVNRARMTPEVAAGYLKPYDSWANRIANQRFVQDIPLSPSHPSWSTAKQVEENIHLFDGKPMLICWGKQDFCFDDYFLDNWKEEFPSAEVHEFADAGHFVVEDAAEAIIPLMRDFLG